MRFRFVLLILALALAPWPLAGQTAPAAGPSLNPEQANIRKAKDIVQKAIQALGGQAYLTFRNMRQQGRGYGFYQNTSQGVGVPVVHTYEFPDKDRFDYFRNGEWNLLYVGDNGYETTFHGTREQEKDILTDFLRRRQYSLDHVLREWVPDAKTAWFYDGQTVMETRIVDKISLLNSQNLGISLYIDQKNFLPVAKSFTYRDPESREKTEEIELYDGYRREDGIMTPHVVTRKENGEMRSQFFLNKVEYNVPVPQDEFTPPPLHWDINKK